MYRSPSRVSIALVFLCVCALPTLAKSNSIDPKVPVIWLDLSKPGDVAYDFAIDPVNPANIYVGTADAWQPVIYTNDFGRTWITATEGLPVPSNAQSVAVDPISPNYVYAGLTLGQGIYRSDDGAKTWHRKDSGVVGDPTIEELVVHPVTPTLVFAGSAYGIPYVYRSDNRGEIWTSIPLTGPNNRTVAQILVDPHNPAKIYAVVPYEGVFISTDAGLTWTNSGIQAEAIVVDPVDPDIIYRLDCYLYRSEDGGSSWDLVETPEPCYQNLHMDPTNGNVLYLTSQYRRVTRSVNGGQSWMALDRRFGGGPAPTSSVFAIDPVKTTRIYVYGQGQGYSGMYVGLYLDKAVYLPVVTR